MENSSEEGRKAYTGSGTICPADPRAKKSERYDQDNWKYFDGSHWLEGEFDLTDNCHPKEH